MPNNTPDTLLDQVEAALEKNGFIETDLDDSTVAALLVERQRVFYSSYIGAPEPRGEHVSSKPLNSMRKNDGTAYERVPTSRIAKLIPQARERFQQRYNRWKELAEQSELLHRTILENSCYISTMQAGEHGTLALALHLETQIDRERVEYLLPQVISRTQVVYDSIDHESGL